MIIGKYNYRHNVIKSRDFCNGNMINGQALNTVSEMRYGLCHMSFNGCEVISVYNALAYLKKTVPLCDIAFYMEKFKVLFGIFGCNVFKIGKALKHYGINYVRSKEIGSAEIFIVSFWTGKRLLSSIHTVFCTRGADGINIYNKYNSCPDVRTCKENSEISSPEKIIAVYIIKGD